MSIRVHARWWTRLMVATLILLAIIIVVYQRISVSEVKQNSSNTESDVYWLKENITNQLEHSQKKITSMMNNVQQRDDSPEQFITSGTQLINGNAALIDLEWLDVDGTSYVSVYDVSNKTDRESERRKKLEQISLNQAKDNKSMMASGAYLMSDGDHELSVMEPLYDEANQLKGFLKSRYSLTQLFRETSPDWLSKKYHIHIDQGTKSIYQAMYDSGAPFDDAYPISIQTMRLAGVEFSIKAQLYPDQQIWLLRSLFVAMFFLLLTLLGSLSALSADMRRRRQVEKELIEQNSLRSAIELSLSVGIRAHALDGSMFYINSNFLEMVGYEEHEILHRPPPLPYIPDEEAQKMITLLSDMIKDPTTKRQIEVKMRKKSGELIDTILRGGPMHNDKGSVIGWVSSVEDVTEHKRLELLQENEQKRLEKVNHLISMGEMASSIAHELNQPLSAISGYATGLSNYIQKGKSQLSQERLVDVTEKIRRQAERASNVTRRVQQFAKQKTIEPVATDVASLINQAIEFMELELRQKKCTIRNHAQGLSLPKTLVDNTMMQQIFINIIRNAIDAMIEANTPEKTVDVYVYQHNASQLMVRIVDTGPGIDEDKVETIFKPFYSSKPQGVGIGLNICRTMIESNGGRLWAQSSRSGGIFYLTMPILQPEDLEQ